MPRSCWGRSRQAAEDDSDHDGDREEDDQEASPDVGPWGDGSWMFRGSHPFVRSLKPNSMSVKTFNSCRAIFDPTGSFAVRHPVENKETGRVTLPRPGEEVMYHGLVKVGMRIPFAPRLLELLRCFGLAPALLTPHGFVKWIAFIRMCKLLGVTYSLTAFRCLFRACIRSKGVTGFMTRNFTLSGPAAKARGAEMRWEGMTLSEEKHVDVSSHYRRSYFMYEGPGLVEWDVNPRSPEHPVLEDLSNDDIRCLRAFCKLQVSGSFEPISWKVLYGRGMSDLRLQPGSWLQDVPEPAPRMIDEGAIYARGYDKGCQETRKRVVEQLYRYNRKFPFVEIPEIAVIGASLFSRPGESAGVDSPWNSFPGDVAGPSTVVHAGEDEDARQGAVVGEASIFGAPASPGIDAITRDWGSNWSFLNTTAVQEAQEGWDFLNVAGMGDGNFGIFEDPDAVRLDGEGRVASVPDWPGPETATFPGMDPGFPLA